MLRFESHVFVLCTVLALLVFVVQANPECTENENNDGCNEEISKSDDDGIDVAHVLDQWNAKRTKNFESLLEKAPDNEKEFLEKYISLMKSLKGEEQLAGLMGEAFAMDVSTETIYMDSYTEIMHFDKAEDMLKRYLVVVFDNNPYYIFGEKNDWLYLLCKEIFDPSHRLFRYVDPNDTDGYLEINPNPNYYIFYLRQYKFVGRVFGFALYYEKRMRVNLIPSFYERILGDNLKMKDTAEQMSAFIEGLTELIPLDELRKFNATELELLFCDTHDLKLEEWKKYTVYKQNIKKRVQWFWEIIEGYNESERRKILLFATGTDALPVTGFKNDWLPFKIKRKNPITPFAIQHVRANEPYRTIEIPPYKSKEELIKQMDRIVGKYENEIMN